MLLTQFLQFQDLVGEGGNGRAALYVKLNEHGQILQVSRHHPHHDLLQGNTLTCLETKRIVSKESFIGQLWNEPTVWHGEVNDRVPIEAGLHRLLPTHRHIIEYLGFHVNKQLRMVRLYTAFAQLGDLLQLIDNHKELERLRDENGRPLEAVSHIPNLAVLYIFEAMAAGVCLMAHGALPDDEGKWPGNGGEGESPQNPWEHNIIHRDIKPNNFFVSASSSNLIWPGLPVAALGDFGNGIDLADQVYTLHPDWARGLGTPRFMAPEQVERPPIPHALHPITSATNVYQIGLCMLHIMTRDMPAYQPTYPDYQRALFDPNIHYECDAQLKDLAWQCVEMLPSERPSAKNLYMILRQIATKYPQIAGGHGVPYRK